MLRARAPASAAFVQLQQRRARAAAPGQCSAMRLWLPRPAGFCGAPCRRQRARYGTAVAGAAGRGCRRAGAAAFAHPRGCAPAGLRPRRPPAMRPRVQYLVHQPAASAVPASPAAPGDRAQLQHPADCCSSQAARTACAVLRPPWSGSAVRQRPLAAWRSGSGGGWKRSSLQPQTMTAATAAPAVARRDSEEASQLLQRGAAGSAVAAGAGEAEHHQRPCPAPHQPPRGHKSWWVAWPTARYTCSWNCHAARLGACKP
jgi:hypothetical protein